MKYFYCFLLIALSASCDINRKSTEKEINEIFDTDDNGNKHGLYLKMRGDKIIEKYTYNHGDLDGRAELRLGDTVKKKSYNSGQLMEERLFIKDDLLLEKTYYNTGQVQRIRTYFPYNENEFGYNLNSSVSFTENGAIELGESNFIYHYKKGDTITIKTPFSNTTGGKVEIIGEFKDRYDFTSLQEINTTFINGNEFRFIIQDNFFSDNTCFFRVELKRKSSPNIYLRDVNFFKIDKTKKLDSINIMPLR